MTLTITIDGTDRTNAVELSSITITDNVNQKVDTASFSIRTTATQTFTPEVGSEVIIADGADKLFGGIIVRRAENFEAPGLLRYDVQCKDYTQVLDRLLVTERYENVTINDIIADLVANYATDFTDDNVDAAFAVESITFNRIPVSEAIQKLADLSGFSWYVDYDKDIHFFEKSTNSAPFDLADDDGNYIPRSLVLTDNFDQLRNRVFVRGGEAAGEDRTESFDGDGSKLFFKLANKYKTVPTATIGGVSQTVGVDYLDQEADFDCFWSFNEKYVRFKVAPASGTDNVEVAGTPLFPIIAQVEDPDSIAEHGVYEFALTDTTITSRKEARNYAAAQLLAYATGVIEGSFRTYTSGLRSGQILHVTARSRDDDFLVQSVRFTMVTPQEGHWEVTLATLKTVGIIDFLVRLLRQGDKTLIDSDSEVLDKAVFEDEQITIDESTIASKTHNPQSESASVAEVDYTHEDYGTTFVAGPYTPQFFPDLVGPSAWYGDAWYKRVKVTIDHTKVPNSDLSNFPAMVDLSGLGSDFWTNVQNGGGDIRVTSSDGVTELAREVVSCVTSGQTGLIFVKIPTLSHTTDTVIYIYYKNSSASDYAAGATYGRNAVWSVFNNVYHLFSDANDSASSGNNGTLKEATQGAGYVSFPGEVLIDSSISGAATQPFGKVTTYQKIAQSFVMGPASTAQIDILLRKLANGGTPTSQVTVAIQADSGGSPSGTDIATYNKSATNWGFLAVGSDVIATSNALTSLVQGNTYWIVLRVDVNSDTNFYNVAYDPAASHGTLKYHNGTSWNTITGALRFAVYKSGYITLASTITLAIQNMATSFVLKKTDTAYESVLANNVGDGTTSGHLEVNGQGGGQSTGRLTYRAASAGNPVTVTGSLNTADGNWHWITVVRDVVSTRFYVDGALYGTAATDAVGANTFKFIGAVQNRINNTYGTALNGLLKEVRFAAATSITADWVAANYNNQSAPSSFYAVAAAEGYDRRRAFIANGSRVG